MSEFKVIETQEQFDNAISERIARIKDKHSAELEELKTSNSKQVEELKSSNSKQLEEIESLKSKLENAAANSEQISDLKSKLATYERESVKTKVAIELGIPYELSSKLSGNTEEEIREDAEKLSKYVGQKNKAPQFNNQNTSGGDSKAMALKQMRDSLFK